MLSTETAFYNLEDFTSNGIRSQLRQFKLLHAERNPNDRDTQQSSRARCSSARGIPETISQMMFRIGVPAPPPVPHLLSEGEEAERCKFEALEHQPVFLRS